MVHDETSVRPKYVSIKYFSIYFVLFSSYFIDLYSNSRYWKMFRQPQPQLQLQLQRTASTVPKTYRCTGNYSLGQAQSSSWQSSPQPPITENDLLKYKDLNMDLKELNNLFKDLNKKKTQKNSNIRKLKKNSTQSNRSSIEQTYQNAETAFAKNIKKILSVKIRDKVLQRLDKLINSPKEERLNKVACTLAALLEVLKSCGVSISNEILIKKYIEKITSSYPSGFSAATEFLNDILEKKDISLTDFIAKQSTHKKKLGEILRTTIKELQECPP